MAQQRQVGSIRLKLLSTFNGGLRHATAFTPVWSLNGEGNVGKLGFYNTESLISNHYRTTELVGKRTAAVL